MLPSCLLNKSLKVKKEEKKPTSLSAKVLFASLDTAFISNIWSRRNALASSADIS